MAEERPRNNVRRMDLQVRPPASVLGGGSGDPPYSRPGTVLQARGLSKTFSDRPVLRRVDLDLSEGEIVALLGCNGAGKTTLLRCLAGLLRPTGGEIRWFGHPVASDPQFRGQIGMASHQSHVYPHLTARENLVFAARMVGLDDPGREADRWLDAVGLAPYAHRESAHLSQGMRQRLALARALVHSPRIVLLDEPFSGLDAEACAWLAGLLRELRDQDRSVCWTTHDHPLAWQLADRVLQVRAGRLEELTPGPNDAEQSLSRARAA